MMSSLKRRLALALLLSPAVFAAHAQVSITSTGTPYTQDFNSLATSGTANTWTDDSTLAGWYSQFSAVATNPTTYRADAGTSNTGAIYSYGTGTATERAFGSVSSGTPGTILNAVRFVNNTGSTITSLDISYTGEQWRDGGAATPNAQSLFFEYEVASAGTVTDANTPSTGWTAFSTLDFTSPTFTNTASGVALDGNNAANRATLSANLPVTVAPGEEVWLRWRDANDAGNDHGLAIDDLSVTANAGAVTPSLSISSTSAAEGDSGTAPFFFTITSTQAAPAGGISVDYATSDNTATTADNDYVAKSGTATIAEGETSVTISVDVNGDTTTEANETFNVDLSNAVGATIGGGHGVGTINNDDVTLTPIHDIQGNGDSSPLVGQTVYTRGIVTGRKSNGFFLQAADADADADPATSEGVYVFTSSAPPTEAAVGNLVQVQATVSEYSPSQDPLQPPLTELGFATVTLLSTGNALPTPVPLTATFPDPEGAYDQLERVEGMRVSAASLTVVGPTDGTTNEPNATGSSNGVFYATVTGDPRPFRTPGIQAPDPAPSGSIPPIPRWDTAPETMEVDSDAIGASKLDLAAGAVVTGVVGPMDYGFRRYTILPEATPTVASTGETVTAARLPSDDEFTVASYNLERFFDDVNDPAIGEPVLTATAFANRLNKASLGIRDELHTPDVLAVMEMENLSTLQQLASKIDSDAIANGDEDPQYVAYLQEGNDVGGIDVGFLVKTADVIAGTPRIEVVDVTQYGKDTTWIDPSDNTADLLNDRPPLLLRAVVHYADGRSFPISVLAVHQRSLNGISDETVSGFTTAGDRVRKKRQAQAEYLANLIQDRQTTDPAEHLVVAGDFNAFDFNDGYVDPMGVVTGLPTPDDQTVVPNDGADLVDPDLLNLHYLPEADKRYSYVFDGQAQSLDHILINQALGADVSSYDLDHARMNADSPETNRNDANSPSRLSDHDPAIAYFAVPTVTQASLGVSIESSLGPGSSTRTVAVGTPLTFHGYVSSNGPDQAINPGVGFAFNAAMPDLHATEVNPGWTCDAPQIVGDTTTVACNGSKIGAYENVFFDFDAAATATTIPGTLIVAAAVTSETYDPEPGDDHAQLKFNVVQALPKADVSVALVRTGVASGNVANFQLTLANNGPDTAQSPSLLISADNGSGAVLTMPIGWSCQHPPSRTFVVECERSPMPAGTIEVARFSMIVSRAQPLNVRATFTDPADPDFGNDTGEYHKP